MISDNLLNASQHGLIIICQQNNCCTIRTHGLSSQISNVLGVNPYAKRRLGSRNCARIEDRSVPGTVDIMVSPISPLYVANMYAQYAPGECGKYPSYFYGVDIQESPEQRLRWFQECCQKLHGWLVQNHISQIGVPDEIGCGLAAGDWSQYLPILEKELPEAVLFRRPL